MPETRCETVSELDSLHDVHSPYLDSNWRGEYKNDLPTSFTAVAVADRQVSMPKQGRGVSGVSRRAKKAGEGANRARKQVQIGLGASRPETSTRCERPSSGRPGSFLRAMGSRSTKVSNRTFVAGPPTSPRCMGWPLTTSGKTRDGAC